MADRPKIFEPRRLLLAAGGLALLVWIAFTFNGQRNQVEIFEAVRTSPSTVSLGVGSCNQEPFADELEETTPGTYELLVRARLPGGDACAESLSIDVDPLHETITIIDRVSGESFVLLETADVAGPASSTAAQVSTSTIESRSSTTTPTPPTTVQDTPERSESIAAVTFPEWEEPVTECMTLYGREPWVIMHSRQEDATCVNIAEFQDVQIWNKGTERLTVDWADGQHVLGSDDSFATGPIGETLAPGNYSFESRPFPMPEIRIIAPDESPTAGLSINPEDETFGPIMLGMTIAEATEELGYPFLSGGPVDPHAYVLEDPYSPRFTVLGAERVIIQIDSADGRTCISSTIDCSPDDEVLLRIRSFIAGEPYLSLHEDAVLSLASAGYDDLVQPLWDATNVEPMTDATLSEPWIFEVEHFAGYSGPFDVRIPPPENEDDVVVTIGEHNHCASPPLPPPEILEGVEFDQYSIQPTGVESCLQWTALDIFVDEDNLIRVVRREIWEP